MDPQRLKLLKADFRNVIESFINKPVTPVLLVEIRERIDDMFFNHNLQEIEFNVLHRENAVVIQGVRNIDCLALQCILDTLKNPDL